MKFLIYPRDSSIIYFSKNGVKFFFGNDLTALCYENKIGIDDQPAEPCWHIFGKIPEEDIILSDVQPPSLDDCPKCLEAICKAMGINQDSLNILLKNRTNGSIKLEGAEFKIGKLLPVYSGLTGEKNRVKLGSSCPVCNHSVPMSRYPAYFEWV